jgi:hypothetical protein
MAKTTKKSPAVKPQRTMRYDAVHGLLTITDGVSATYHVEEIGSQFGRGFRMTKLGADGKPVPARGIAAGQYDLHLSGNGQQSCECPSALLRNTCRHCESLRKLIDLGKIIGGYPGAEPEACCNDE